MSLDKKQGYLWALFFCAKILGKAVWNIAQKKKGINHKNKPINI